MNIQNLIKENFYFRQHPEAALRYLPIVDLLKSKKLDKSKILEVGSGSYGITPYLKRKVVGVDTLFDEPKYQLLEQVNGSAIKLPFASNSFDAVILSDVLEHIPPNLRQKSVIEAVRVAKKVVIISGPFGNEAFEQDKYLAKYSKEKTGTMHKFFEEHLKYGLPEVGEIWTTLKDNQKIEKIQVIGHYLNLKIREKLMKTFILGQNKKLVYYFYLKGLMPSVTILKKLNRRPCYRTLILITIRVV